MTTGFYNYLKLIANDTPYARRMTRLRNSIFGDIVRPTSQKSMKIFRLLSVEPHYKMSSVKNYYPRHVETGLLVQNLRDYGLFRDEHRDFQLEMIRLRTLRGKIKKKPERKPEAEAAKPADPSKPK